MDQNTIKIEQNRIELGNKIDRRITINQNRIEQNNEIKWIIIRQKTKWLRV